jgi:endonuclease-3
MATQNRAALIAKTHKVLKKHYEPIDTTDRPLLEQLLFALCLENSGYATAERVFAELQATYFDWNEVRVTTVVELAETMGPLHDARSQATNLKRALQSVFETTYSFDLETFKKKNIGQAIKDLEKMAGVTPFAIAFVTQSSLAGHAVPIDRGALESALILGIASPKEAEAGGVPGLERAIPKNKGIEFGSLLHQLGADLLAKPFSNEVRDLFLSIAPDAKERLPKRGVKKEPEAPLAKPTAAPKPSAVPKPGVAAKPGVAEKPHSKESAGEPAKEPAKADAKAKGKPEATSAKAKVEAKDDKAKSPGKAPEKPAKKSVGAEKVVKKDAAKKPIKGKDEKPAGKGLAKSKPR